MRDRKLTTAHEAWDANWSDARERADWLEPEAWVADIVPLLRERGARRTLDVGCGLGRHALLLARAGFDAHGLDASPTGLAFGRRAALQEGLDVSFCRGAFVALPYREASFGHALIWNVIYHGDGDDARQAVREVARVLTPGGLMQGTLLSKRNALYGAGTEVKPNTFIDAGPGEKAHPHFYCDAAELRHLLGAFRLLALREREHREPGAWHWEFTAEAL